MPSSSLAVSLALVLAATVTNVASAARKPAKTAERKGETVQLLVAEGVLTLTFDPSRIARGSVETAIQVSPEADIPGIDILLEACDPNERQYSDCKEAKPGTKGFLRNATINVNRAVVKLKKLRRLEVPRRLKKPHEFLVRNGQFYVWLLKTRLEFLRSGQVRVLKREFGDVKPAVSCELALDRVDAAETGDKAFRIARTDWHNCVNHVFNERVGKYPKKEWDEFLAAYGIRENLEAK